VRILGWNSFERRGITGRDSIAGRLKVEDARPDPVLRPSGNPLGAAALRPFERFNNGPKLKAPSK